MKIRFSYLLPIGAALVFAMAGCDDDDDPQIVASEEYVLSSVSDPAISGTVTFAKRSDNKSVITIDLNGTQAGNSHPAHIHGNSAVQGGGILLDLTNVDGADGMSETIVETLNDGTPITYEQLLEFDGYVNVHASSANLGTLIAQGDIGQNELTEDNEVYPLNSVSDPAISGTATFAKRKNGYTLVTIQLEGTSAGGDHPSHIHANDAATGGPIVLDFNNIEGGTGISRTNVTQLNDGTDITYDELLEFDGYINVHFSPTQLATLIAQGNIGANAQ